MTGASLSTVGYAARSRDACAPWAARSGTQFSHPVEGQSCPERKFSWALCAWGLLQGLYVLHSFLDQGTPLKSVPHCGLRGEDLLASCARGPQGRHPQPSRT